MKADSIKAKKNLRVLSMRMRVITVNIYEEEKIVESKPIGANCKTTTIYTSSANVYL